MPARHLRADDSRRLARQRRQETEMQSDRFRMFLAAALLAAGSLTLGACNTMEGAGKDIQKGGEKIEDAARSVKNKL
jgi:entericidin B